MSFADCVESWSVIFVAFPGHSCFTVNFQARKTNEVFAMQFIPTPAIEKYLNM